MNASLSKNPPRISGRPRLGREALAFDERDTRLVFWRVTGESYSQLGRRFGISRQRVAVILQILRPDLLGRRPPRAEA